LYYLFFLLFDKLFSILCRSVLLFDVWRSCRPWQVIKITQYSSTINSEQPYSRQQKSIYYILNAS
jgi:hypothetical protein